MSVNQYWCDVLTCAPDFAVLFPNRVNIRESMHRNRIWHPQRCRRCSSGCGECTGLNQSARSGARVSLWEAVALLNSLVAPPVTMFLADHSCACDPRNRWYGHVSCFVIDFIHVVLRSSHVKENAWEFYPHPNQSSLPRSQEAVFPLPYQAPDLSSRPSTSDRKNRLRLTLVSVSTDDTADRLF